MSFENYLFMTASSGKMHASSRHNFDDHVSHRIVSLPEAYCCEVCGKQYVYKASLDMHLEYNPFCQQMEPTLVVPMQESENFIIGENGSSDIMDTSDSVQELTNSQNIDPTSLKTTHNLLSLDDNPHLSQNEQEESRHSQDAWPQPLVIVLDEDDEKLDSAVHALPNVKDTQISSSPASPEHSNNGRSPKPLTLNGFSTENHIRDNHNQSTPEGDDQQSSLPTTALSTQQADHFNKSHCQKSGPGSCEEPSAESGEQPIAIDESDATDSTQNTKSPKLEKEPLLTGGDNEQSHHSLPKSPTNSKLGQIKATKPIRSKSPLKNISNSQPIKCPECKKEFNRKKGLYKHLEIHRRKVRTCEACGKVFNSSSGYQKHRSKNIACKNFVKSSLHVPQEQDKKPLNETSEKPSLTVLPLSSGVSKAKDAVSNGDLQIPESPANPDTASTSATENANPQFFKCPMCPGVFNDQSRLKHHMHVHATTKPFPCDVCGQRYANKKSLSVHKKKHVNIGK